MRFEISKWENWKLTGIVDKQVPLISSRSECSYWMEKNVITHVVLFYIIWKVSVHIFVQNVFSHSLEQSSYLYIFLNYTRSKKLENSKRIHTYPVNLFGKYLLQNCRRDLLRLDEGDLLIFLRPYFPLHLSVKILIPFLLHRCIKNNLVSIIPIFIWIWTLKCWKVKLKK